MVGGGAIAATSAVLKWRTLARKSRRPVAELIGGVLLHDLHGQAARMRGGRQRFDQRHFRRCLDVLHGPIVRTVRHEHGRFRRLRSDRLRRPAQRLTSGPMMAALDRLFLHRRMHRVPTAPLPVLDRFRWHGARMRQRLPNHWFLCATISKLSAQLAKLLWFVIVTIGLLMRRSGWSGSGFIVCTDLSSFSSYIGSIHSFTSLNCAHN